MGLKRYGEVVRAAREKAGVSQGKLAKLLKVTRASVSQMEQGKYTLVGEEGRLDVLLRTLPTVTEQELQEALAVDTPDDPAASMNPRRKRPAAITREDILANRYGAKTARTIVEAQDRKMRIEVSAEEARLLAATHGLDKADIDDLTREALMRSIASRTRS